MVQAASERQACANAWEQMLSDSASGCETSSAKNRYSGQPQSVFWSPEIWQDPAGHTTRILATNLIKSVLI